MPKNPFPSILYVNVANANVLCQTLVSNWSVRRETGEKLKRHMEALEAAVIE